MGCRGPLIVLCHTSTRFCVLLLWAGANRVDVDYFRKSEKILEKYTVEQDFDFGGNECAEPIRNKMRCSVNLFPAGAVTSQALSLAGRRLDGSARGYLTTPPTGPYGVAHQQGVPTGTACARKQEKVGVTHRFDRDGAWANCLLSPFSFLTAMGRATHSLTPSWRVTECPMT